MGISRSSKNKRRLTGGRMPIHRKKRKFEMGRQASSTKLGERKVISVRCRGGNIKRRALRLNDGNFTWVSEKVAKKCKILEVIYNATNNELVRTQTIVKNSIVAVDPTPFKYYWYIHYDDKRVPKLPEIVDPERKKELEEKREKLKKVHPMKDLLEKQHHFFELMNKGRLYACITSRPGQAGRADGYLLEGKELEFYIKKLEKK
jgi:small subunit ribosomal protein S8e